jgi:replicative superfamily II helicase
LPYKKDIDAILAKCKEWLNLVDVRAYYYIRPEVRKIIIDDNKCQKLEDVFNIVELLVSTPECINNTRVTRLKEDRKSSVSPPKKKIKTKSSISSGIVNYSSIVVK